MPDGSNAFGNSMWTNSVTTGNWEDYIALDLVEYIDKKYRTDARSASRGIAGHSSGGYGAIKLAMKHPQVFGAVYALSACCLGWDKGPRPHPHGRRRWQCGAWTTSRRRLELSKLLAKS
jgi:S-formylglutathione hydrolase